LSYSVEQHPGRKLDKSVLYNWEAYRTISDKGTIPAEDVGIPDMGVLREGSLDELNLRPVHKKLIERPHVHIGHSKPTRTAL